MNKEVINKVLKFREERDWKQFHDPKSLAASLVIEASELLEILQWTKTEDSKKVAKEKIKEIKEEIADILVYLIYLSEDLDIDWDEVLEEKLKINGEKYPVDKAKGTSKKYTELK